MKKFVILLLMLPISFVIKAQTVTPSDIRKYSVTQETKVPFRLFPTSNDWNFIKLDTRTGQLWHVQFYVGDGYENKCGTFTIDDTPIEEASKENIGRFTIYPTNNYWNFILLDQYDGRTWLFQYSLKDSSNNFRKRIY